MQRIRWFFRKVWQFFKWLVVRWHISYVSIGFYGVAVKHVRENPDQMMAFVEENAYYYLVGILIEVFLMRKKLFPSRATIPKQPERT